MRIAGGPTGAASAPREPQVLDNPIWHSLNTLHAHLATGTPLAKRYPAEVARTVAIVDSSEAAVHDLSRIVSAGETVAIVRAQVPSELQGWKIEHREEIFQMICERFVIEPEPSLPVSVLTTNDVREMLGLIELTKPGPFLPRTIEMGRYVGLRQDGELVAMAGERFGFSGYREISAVCTHPDHQGKGYARQLASYLVNDNFRRGNVPFLHVRTENTRACALYETLNFRTRCKMGLLILSR